MGAYKFYNPSTEQWEIIKSKSIIKDDGSLEYTPDEVKEMDDKITILSGVSGTKEKANKEDLETHKADDTSAHGGVDADSILNKLLTLTGFDMSSFTKAVTGSYVGDGIYTRDIILGYKPKNLDILRRKTR